MEKNEKLIVGLGGSGHEWSTAAIAGNEIVAISEERLCRKKYGLGTDLLAARSRRACLDHLNAKSDQVSHFVACSLVPKSFYFGVRQKTKIINHHLAHAYFAFHCSGYEESAILIADNSGSILSGNKLGSQRVVETISMFVGNHKGIELVNRIEGIHKLEVSSENDYYTAGETSNSLGHLYRTASLILGFAYANHKDGATFSEDGKTMGIAAFGDDRFVEKIGLFVSTKDNGKIVIPTRNMESVIRNCLGKGSFDECASLAYAVQYHTERALLHCAKYLLAKTGLENLCIGGGVGLNSVANGRLQLDSGFRRVFVPPAPGDDGISLGCCIYGLHRLLGCGIPDLPKLQNAYLGPIHDEEEIGAALLGRAFTEYDIEQLAMHVAGLLFAGCIVGIYQGRSEFGPRALGNRSILAPPTPAYVRDKLNHVVKHREWFRPYGVIVPKSRVADYFDYQGESPFMSFVAKVKEPLRLAAATHVDGSARFQTVTASSNPFIFQVIKFFEAHSGTAAIINTSFNCAGEPIVETASQAIQSAESMNLDALVINSRLSCMSDTAKQFLLKADQ